MAAGDAESGLKHRSCRQRQKEATSRGRKEEQ
jgi:hypothetical protein